jgi:hypothetical protein
MNAGGNTRLGILTGGHFDGQAGDSCGGFVWAVGGRFAGLACVGHTIQAVAEWKDGLGNGGDGCVENTEERP